MSSSKTTTILTYGLLAGAAGVAFLLPASLGPRHGIASPAPSQVDIAQLDGFIRDFTSTHPDFNTTASAGNGHYAGNIALGLGSDERPVFTANGSKVIMQWNDRTGHNLAPHMYMNIFGDPGTMRSTRLFTHAQLSFSHDTTSGDTCQRTACSSTSSRSRSPLCSMSSHGNTVTPGNPAA